MTRWLDRRSGFVKALGGGFVALVVVFAYFYFSAPEATKVKVGMRAPELELQSYGPGTVKLSSFRGRPVLLVFFMSECKICEAEIEEVERVHREFRARGLVVLGVSLDADYAARERFVARHKLTFAVLRDPNGPAVRQAFGSWKMPEAYLIDATGRVAAVWLGSVDWRGGEARRKIRELLPR